MFSVPKHDYCKFLHGRWADPLKENMCLKPGVVLNSLPSLKDGRMSCFGGFLLHYQFHKCFHFQNVTVNHDLSAKLSFKFFL